MVAWVPGQLLWVAMRFARVLWVVAWVPGAVAMVLLCGWTRYPGWCLGVSCVCVCECVCCVCVCLTSLSVCLQVMLKNAHMAVGSLTINEERSEVIDFSVPS